ncbi:MAG TPA: NAD(P)/FAD-dependent oxidoreductase, partial [Gemmatimonadales bacterium]|nr:NAD(P)/FAD-dependent oxidoreductase [Gemmatimonadales bacterium]
LAGYARQVHVVVRKPGLGANMSRYLVERIESMKNVTIHGECTVSALGGNGRLAAVDVRDRSGGVWRLETGALFLFIGADANSQWLRGCVELDRNGFVLTGPALPAGTSENERWPAIGRSPFLLETSLPGVFAAGDVRSGSVKRCATAVGEGAMAVNFVHQHIGPAVVAA